MEFAVIPGWKSGVTPEFEVTREPGVCIHSGAQNLESLRGLESRINPKYGGWSLDVLRSMSSASTRKSVVLIHSGV